MRDAFADRVDARVERLHRVVDDDAAVAMQAGGLRELDVGPDADRHHDEVAPAASRRPARRTAATRPDLAGDERLRLRLEPEREALAPRATAAAGRRRVRSSWRSISHGIRCTTVTSMPRALQPVRGLEPEQAAADDDRVACARRRVDHRLGVGDVAVGDHAGKVRRRGPAG